MQSELDGCLSSSYLVRNVWNSFLTSAIVLQNSLCPSGHRARVTLPWGPSSVVPPAMQAVHRPEVQDVDVFGAAVPQATHHIRDPVGPHV